MTTTLLTLALTLPAAPVPAPKATTPKGPPPRVVAVSLDADGAPVITHVRARYVPQQVTRRVLVGGQVQTVTETVNVAVQESIALKLDGEGAEVYGSDGKKLEPGDVRKLITRPVPALVSADGKPVDPFYLRLAREGTPVIVVPTKEPEPGAAPKGGEAIKLPRAKEGAKLPTGKLPPAKD